MNLLICGSRHWQNRPKMEEILSLELPEGPHNLIHGGAPGADSCADAIAREWADTFTKVTPYPADWQKYGRRAGPMRNQTMVDFKPDRVLAFMLPQHPCHGTYDCVKRAVHRGIEVRIYTPLWRKLS